MLPPAVVIPSARGIFCAFRDLTGNRNAQDRVQKWGPGSDNFFKSESRGDRWCRTSFPVESAERRLLDTRGAVWIRRLDDRWIICHTYIPLLTRARSTASWALVAVSDNDFETEPILGAAIADVVSATVSDDSIEQWALTRATWPATPWDRRTVGVVATMFDANRRVGDQRGHLGTILPEGMLDFAGLTALQLMLVYMHRSGVVSPTAVLVREPGWSAPASALPSGAMVFEQLPRTNAGSGAQLVIRGVDVCSFASSFVECSSLLRGIATEVKRGVMPANFREAATPFVPLSSIDPAELQRAEWDPWVAGLCQSSRNVADIERRTNDLVERVERGEKTLVGLAIRLAAAWCDVVSSSETAGEQRSGSRVDGWVSRLARRA